MITEWKLCASIVLAALVLAPIGQCDVTADNQRILLTRVQDAQGRKFDYYVAVERLLGTPKWDLAEQLPLTVSKAASIARDSLKRRIISAQKLQVLGIALERLTVQGTLDKYWFYTVNVAVFGEGDEARGPSFEKVVILFDGTIVEPVLTKD